jgi:4-hydroxybenzoate polyprenyltransferase
MKLDQPRSGVSTLRGTLPARGIALIQAMRPRQWTKNLLVFAALIFDLQLDEPGRVGLAMIAFGCFCLASGGVYLVNDLVDREADRRHPVKRLRPIASGRLPERLAVFAAATAFVLSPGVAALIGPGFGVIIVSYLALMQAYSFWIKHVVILDVFAISGGFVLRAAGGAVALGVPISPWLYVCTVLLALFLGFGKRRNEIRLLEHAAGLHRRNLDEYSVGLLDQLIMLTAAATIMSYSLYTFTAPTLPANHAMMLVYVRDEGGAPEQLLLSDRPLLGSVMLWAVVAVAILYGPLA